MRGPVSLVKEIQRGGIIASMDMRLASSLLLLPLVLAACSVKSAADDDEPTTTSPGSGSDESGGSVLDLLDDGQCDVWLQDCPEDHKCVPYASSGGTWDAFKCVPILGERKPGATCTSAGKVEATDDCGPGLVCWEVSESDGELVGKCASLCTGDVNDPQCSVGKSCVIAAENHAPAVCGTDCNVLLQDCEAPSGCTFAAGEFTCMGNQGLELGEPCEHFDDC